MRIGVILTILALIFTPAYSFGQIGTPPGGGPPPGGVGTPPPPAGGQTQAITITIPNPLSCTDITCVLGQVLNSLLILAVPIVTIMALIAGYQILFAAGDPEKASRGRRTLLYAAIGFAVILLATSLSVIITLIIG